MCTSFDILASIATGFRSTGRGIVCNRQIGANRLDVNPPPGSRFAVLSNREPALPLGAQLTVFETSFVFALSLPDESSAVIAKYHVPGASCRVQLDVEPPATLTDCV